MTDFNSVYFVDL